MKSTSLFSLSALVLALSSGCVDSLSEESRPCPCTAGWTCCASTQTCVADGTACPAPTPGKDDDGPEQTPDGVPPVTPVLRASIPGSPTASATVTLDGTTEPGAAVALFTTADCSGTPAGTGTADAAGGFRVSAPLRPNASTSFWARATDAAANASYCSAQPLTILHDSVAPVRPSLEALTPGVLSRTSTSPVLSGTAEPRSTVRLYSDAECLTALPFSAAADEAGAFRVWASVEADSTTTFHARAFDAAGNGSPCSTTSLGFTHDGAPPEAPVLTGPTGPLNRAEPDATGTAEPGARVRLFAQADCAGEPLAEGTASPDGAFTLRVTARANTGNTLSAQATDAAGNPSACSAAHTFVHDDIAPPGTWAVSMSPTSPSNASFTPLVEGSAQPGSTVRVYKNFGCLGPAVSGLADSAGRFRIQVELYANAVNFLTTDETDAAGNRSPCSQFIRFEHDATPPSVPLLLGVSEPSPTTVEAPLRVRGKADSGSLVRLYGNATCTGPALASTTVGSTTDFTQVDILFQGLPAATDSTTPFAATATDAAGNTSACSTPLLHTHTRGRGWGPVAVPGQVLPTRSAITGDGAGRTLAVWAERPGNGMDLKASFHTPEAGWSAPEPLVHANAINDSELSVAVSPSGHAVVLWAQYASPRWTVYARRLVPGRGWLPVEELRSSATINSETPAAGIDAAGNAFAVWYEGETSLGGAAPLWGSRATPEGGWEPPLRLSPTGVWSTWTQSLYVSSNGEAWTFWVKNSSELWARHYVPGEGWSEPQRPNEGFSLILSRVDAAVNDSGSLVLTWLGLRPGSNEYEVWVRQFLPGQGWGEPRALYVGRESPELPKLALNARGDALAVWGQQAHPQSQSGSDALWVSQASPGTGWSPATKLRQGSGALYDLQVSLDAEGGALVGWVQTFPWVARFEPGAGWAPAQFLSDESSEGYTLLLQADAQGNALALWRRYTRGSTYITGSRSFR